MHRTYETVSTVVIQVPRSTFDRRRLRLRQRSTSTIYVHDLRPRGTILGAAISIAYHACTCGDNERRSCLCFHSIFLGKNSTVGVPAQSLIDEGYYFSSTIRIFNHVSRPTSRSYHDPIDGASPMSSAIPTFQALDNSCQNCVAQSTCLRGASFCSREVSS